MTAQKRITLDLPSDLYQRLEALATEDRRALRRIIRGS